MVHDRLNREGVEVSNGDETWMLSGDETLNDTSLRIGSKAVAEAEKNLEEAARTPGDLPYDEMIQRVWKLVPHPTDKGHAFIDAVRDELTNAANPAAVDEAVRLSIREINTAIDEMTKMHVLRPKPGTAAGAPASGDGGGAGGAPPTGPPAPMSTRPPDRPPAPEPVPVSVP
jgi:hypothetical protein